MDDGISTTDKRSTATDWYEVSQMFVYYLTIKHYAQYTATNKAIPNQYFWF